MSGGNFNIRMPTTGPMARRPQDRPDTTYGRYTDRVTADEANLANIQDATAREAEQSWLNEYKGGVFDNPSIRKGRLGYDARKEISLQGFYKDKLKRNQVDAYNAFDVDKYIKGNSDIYRRNLSKEVIGAKNNIRGNANARGMLFSGRRQMGEGIIGNQADAGFQKYQQDLIGEALSKKQQLATNSLNSISSGASADLARSLQAQQMQNANNAQQSQLMNSGIGLIGSGMGQYYGNQSSTTTPNATQNTARWDHYNSGYGG